jgi:type II secretory pathway component GspD/PulD (secretin)
MKTAAPLPLLALLLFGACSATPADGTEPSATPANMEELLAEYAAASGTSVTYDEPTGALLASLAVTAVGPEDLRVLKVDRPQGTAGPSAPAAEFEVIRLQYATAPELAQTLSELVDAASEGAASPASPAIKVLSDDRTNSLLVTAPPGHMQELRDLIALLDREVTAGG